MSSFKDGVINWFRESAINTVATVKGTLIHLENSYSSIFKGGISLFLLSLIAISQSYQMITDYDFDIKSEEYAIEEKYGKPMAEISCKTEVIEPSEKAACRLTKYKSGTNNTAMKYGAFIIVTPLFLGSGLIFLSIFGFILRAQKDGQDTSEG